MTGLSRSTPALKRPPFDRVALLLQGGGALGAYQGGVYQALYEAGIEPDWISGISIGAINSAIIAGNPRHQRVEKLREFWETVSNNTVGDWFTECQPYFVRGDVSRGAVNQMSALHAMFFGVNGFYASRPVPPALSEPGSVGATSYYDTIKLKDTLNRLIDFDRINGREIRLTVSAVNVGTGNYVLFDTETHRIMPEHIMASGALPPGFPAVKIDGEYYWDGGLVSNTPLESVLKSKPYENTLAFQVDVWSAQGEIPSAMPEVMTRQKEIMFSSRTRAATGSFRAEQQLRNAFIELYEQLPPALKKTPVAKLLATENGKKLYNIIHLIYNTKNYEGDSKDYEFSRVSMEEHWRAGYDVTVRTLRHKEVLEPHANHDGVFTFDVNHMSAE